MRTLFQVVTLNIKVEMTAKYRDETEYLVYRFSIVVFIQNSIKL